MKREEILEKSRRENKNRDLAEIEIQTKAVKLAALGLLILSTIYFVLEIVFNNKTNYGWYSMIALYCAIAYGYKGIKMKKRISIICIIRIYYSNIYI